MRILRHGDVAHSMTGLLSRPLFISGQATKSDTQSKTDQLATLLVMPFLGKIASALAIVAIGSVDAAFGPAFSTGPVSSNSFIREATSTLILPKAPSRSSGDTSLWVGMGTSNGDLIQSIADNWDSSNWSVFAYTLLSTSGKKPVMKNLNVHPVSFSRNTCSK